MAFPTIIYNASTGNDTYSGAGPATAITGAAGASTGVHTGGVATNVLEVYGTPNLSAVATDGSHAIWINTPSGSRHLSKITGITTPAAATHITVQDTFTIASGASAFAWGIGGKRQSLENDTSNADWADMYAGWTFEFNDGTYANTLAMQPTGGNLTDGPITLKSTNRQGAIFDQTGGDFKHFDLSLGGTQIVIDGFKIQKTNGSWLGSYAVYTNIYTSKVTFINNEVDGAGMGGGVYINNQCVLEIAGNELYGFNASPSSAIRVPSRCRGIVEKNSIHDFAAKAIDCPLGSSYGAMVIQKNTIYDVTTGIDIGATAQGTSLTVRHNTLDGVSGVGLDINTNAHDESIVDVQANIITNCGTGMLGSSVINTDNVFGTRDYNHVWNNTTNYSDITAGANDTTGDPLYINDTDGLEDYRLQSGSPARGVIPAGVAA